jgi:hypothetical protein
LLMWQRRKALFQYDERRHAAASTRLRSNSYFARPYLWRFSGFRRLTGPLTGLVLQSSANPARTAASPCWIPSHKAPQFTIARGLLPGIAGASTAVTDLLTKFLASSAARIG